jgi:SlyX protein
LPGTPKFGVTGEIELSDGVQIGLSSMFLRSGGQLRHSARFVVPASRFRLEYFMGESMEERMTELELRFMQQERTIQELNDTVFRQEKIISRLERQFNLLSEQFRTFEPSSIRDPDEDERPPHY